MGTPSLNDYLQPQNAPIAQNQGAVDSYQFYAQNERSSVNLSRIKNFSFSQGQGGTLVLGGTADGSGVLLIKDSSGNTIVQGDSSGLTVYDGNLLVKDDTNTTIIDTAGIVSSANFHIDQAFSNVQQTTTSTSYTDLSGSSLSFTLDRDSIVLISTTIAGLNNNFPNAGQTDIQCIDSIDGQIQEFYLFGQWAIYNIDFGGSNWSNIFGAQFVSLNTFSALSAGSHELKLQYKKNTAGTAEVDAFILNYSILGS